MEIKNRFTGETIFKDESATIKETAQMAIQRRANLSDADLRGQKNDFWAILLHAPAEIQGLRLALIEGRVDGSTYEGPCACLVGTIANVRNANYQDIGIKPDSSRPAEQWFMYIKKGDTPETNQISRITVEWLDEFVILLNDARVNTYSHDAKIK